MKNKETLSKNKLLEWNNEQKLEVSTITVLNNEIKELKDNLSNTLNNEIKDLKDNLNEELNNTIKELKNDLSNALNNTIKELKETLNDKSNKIITLKEKEKEKQEYQKQINMEHIVEIYKNMINTLNKDIEQLKQEKNELNNKITNKNKQRLIVK